MGEVSPPGPAPRTVAGRVLPALDAAGERVALEDDDRAVPARTVARLARSGARWLREQVPGSGQIRVAACAENSVDVVIAWLATMLAGGLWSSVNARYTDAEKADLLGRFEPHVALGSSLPTRGGGGGVARMSTGGVASELLDVFACAGGPGDLVPVDPFAPAAVGFTSGTTGRPRGIVHSQHNLLLAAEANVGAHKPAGPIGVVLSTMVLNIMVLGPLQAILAGRTAVLARQTGAEYLWDWVRAKGVEEIGVPPTIIFDLLARARGAGDCDGIPLRVETGGAACTTELQEEFARLTGRRIVRAYGLTEAPATVAMQRGAPEDTMVASGLPLPHVGIVVLDGAGHPVAPGAEGEICIGPATTGPYRDLYRPPLGTWEAGGVDPEGVRCRDGRLLTGDLGWIDEGGRLHVTGRGSALIIRGGANISPVEIEEVLVSHPSIADAAVFGVPDRRLGETVAAAIVPASGARPAVDEIKEYVAGRLARFKVPARIAFVDRVPRNPTGKADSAQLLELLAASEPGYPG